MCNTESPVIEGHVDMEWVSTCCRSRLVCLRRHGTGKKRSKRNYLRTRHVRAITPSILSKNLNLIGYETK